MQSVQNVRITGTEGSIEVIIPFNTFNEAVLNKDEVFFTMMEIFSKRNQKMIDSVFEAGDK
ncbi:MAG: hypothetical protein PQJ61_10960 [Spirochaetales bacterium]|uniref:Uncharacterized protein n=1 Tax=Candidatus Thalassospirochaeta sargassi TaxID=3119039 RepID=A0AAJ1MP55_9SPIO|nr:hypothetical protein [Spirochaetales bacterium]